MNSNRFFSLRALFSAATLSCFVCTNAVTQAIAAQFPPSSTSPEEARTFLRLDYARNACKQPLALTVENATLDDIVARVQKTLMAPKSPAKLPIEVRNVAPIRLSFAAKASTVGEILSSTATLAGAKLWVFSDRLLLAAQENLTPAESDDVKKGLGIGGMALVSRVGTNTAKQQAYSTFISAQVNGLKTPTGTSTPTEKLIGSALMGQLSPEAQDMVQELFVMSDEMFKRNQSMNSSGPLPQPSSTSAIELTSSGRLALFVPGTNDITWKMDWSLDGGSMSLGGGPTPSHKPSTSPALPFDPSAGKS